MQDKIPYALIVKHLNYESSKEENELLMDWLNDNEDNIHVFNELVALNITINNLNVNKPVEHRSSSLRIKNLYFYMAAACFIFLLFTLSILTNFFNVSVLKNDTSHVVFKQVNESINVYLNQKSQLEYSTESIPQIYNVNGEIFISIVNKNTSALEVQGEAYTILTTSADFNINTRYSANESIISVEQGELTIIDHLKDDFTFKLTPGQSASYISNYGFISIDQDKYLSLKDWKNGNYYFNDNSLYEITQLLSFDLNKQIYFSEPELQNITITGVFNSDNAHLLLNKILKKQNLSLRIFDNEILISNN